MDKARVRNRKRKRGMWWGVEAGRSRGDGGQDFGDAYMPRDYKKPEPGRSISLSSAMNRMFTSPLEMDAPLFVTTLFDPLNYTSRLSSFVLEAKSQGVGPRASNASQLGPPWRGRGRNRLQLHASRFTGF